MPRIALHGSAIQLFTNRSDVSGKYKFDPDNCQQHPKRVCLRKRVCLLDSSDALNADETGRGNEGKTNDDRRDRFGLTVAVGVIFIGRLDREL